MYVLFSKFT